MHDLTAGIDDADRGLFHGNVEADVVLLPHGEAWGLDRSASMPPHSPRETPRVPYLAFSLLAHRPALTVSLSNDVVDATRRHRRAKRVVLRTATAQHPWRFAPLAWIVTDRLAPHPV